MSDEVECPYCGHTQEIDHSEGYGYKEDNIYHQQCKNCGKSFAYSTYVSFSYNVWKCDCLNDGKHHWELSLASPREASNMICKDCGEERQLTDEERKKYNIGTLKDYLNKLKEQKI